MSTWSSFTSYFSGKKNSDEANKDAIIRMRTGVEQQAKRMNHLQSQVDQKVDEMKKLSTAPKDKQRGIFLMQQKKLIEKSLEDARNQHNAANQQLLNLESAIMNRQAVEFTQSSVKAMQRVNQGITVDRVEQLRDQLDEEIAKNKEIGQLMAQPTDMVDEDGKTAEEEWEEMAAELRREEEEKAQEGETQRLETELASAPHAPVGRQRQTQAVEEDDEAEELERLKREMMGPALTT